MHHTQLLSAILAKYKDILGENLVGIYVHGSIAFGCFHPDKSDIDFIVVVDHKPTQNQKEAIIQTLLDLNDQAPSKGFEMSVLLEKDCRHFRHPAPFELHFSNSHIDQFREDFSAYCKNMHGTDRDLAAHLTVIKHTGIVLYGKGIDVVFGDISKEDYIDSIIFDIENAEEDIVKSPIYVILNLCRMLAYLQTEKVMSKQQGGFWGMQNLPDEFKALAKEAENAYTSGTNMRIDRVTADRYCAYMLSEINKRR